jgi:3-oxoacyl-[acyl-carrier protein] reductase
MSMIDPGLQDKVVLITGANHGIGAATARAFAAQGAAVFLTYLRYPPDPSVMEVPATPGRALYRHNQTATVEPVLRSIREQGGRTAGWEIDLVDPERIPELFDRAEAAFGPVDVLINNAAYCESDSFLPETVVPPGSTAAGGMRLRGLAVPTLDRHFAVNTRAPALLTAEYARRFIGRVGTGGRIINISTDGASAFPGEISYGASKHALESYSRAAAVELGPYGITVNVVSVGPTQTGYIAPEREPEIVSLIPLGRLGRPEDIADAILFFASRQAAWITGQLLYAGGGKQMPL